MNKLSKEIQNACTAENCCMNEMVVLPQDGDVGFDEYFEHKAKEVIRAKKIFSPLDQNKLILAYPKPVSKEPYVFERFFESPSIVARNHEFEGCFAIDISAYIGKTDHEYFEKLMSYMYSNKNAVYLLFFYSDNKNEIQNMYDYLSRYDDIRMVNIPLPDAKTLTDYTVSKIRDFSLHVKSPVYAFLQKYYSRMKCGYDLADYLVRYLRNTGYAGDLPPMKDATEKVETLWRTNNINTGFGY